jgi:hypothetical protein
MRNGPTPAVLAVGIHGRPSSIHRLRPAPVDPQVTVNQVSCALLVVKLKVAVDAGAKIFRSGPSQDWRLPLPASLIRLLVDFQVLCLNIDVRAQSYITTTPVPTAPCPAPSSQHLCPSMPGGHRLFDVPNLHSADHPPPYAPQHLKLRRSSSRQLAKRPSGLPNLRLRVLLLRHQPRGAHRTLEQHPPRLKGLQRSLYQR